MKKVINEELIYEILSVVEEIPRGKVATYGQIASSPKRGCSLANTQEAQDCAGRAEGVLVDRGRTRRTSLDGEPENNRIIENKCCCSRRPSSVWE